MVHILVIEDQEAPWDNYEMTLTQICNIPQEQFVRARWYTEAEEEITSSRQFDLIFLDHRMPRRDPGCTDKGDFNRFAGQLENVGYGLLPLIASKQPNAIVVGTSSLSSAEIGRFTLPEHQIDKTNLFDEVVRIVRSFCINK